MGTHDARTVQAVARVLERGARTAAELATEALPAWGPASAAWAAQETLIHLRDAGAVEGPDADGRYRLTQHAASSDGPQRRPLAEMRGMAERLAAQLRRHAVRLEIAGSVRRQAPRVKDIELCALVEPRPDLFGLHEAPDETGLARALRAGASSVLRGGAKYIQVEMRPQDDGPLVCVELFLTADPAQWGMLYFIRTGSADFVRRALAYWKSITGGGYCRGNRLHLADGTAVDTPEEGDVFAALERYGDAAVSLVPPERRAPR